jgi:AcrR family transcriptional regulator
VFARRGYRLTQMADVGRELGLSPGNLYNYVEGKDALFFLVLRRALGERPGDASVKLPVRGASVAVTAEWVARRLDFVSDFPEMEKALLDGGPLREGEVELIVGELYDVLVRMRLGVEIIERSVEDVPELAEVFGRVRQELLARYERYLRRRTETGQLRVAEPEAVAHVIVDLCWWGAGRRVTDPDTAGISDVVARRTVCRFVADALGRGSDGRPEDDG